jgi:hypothetical protein
MGTCMVGTTRARWDNMSKMDQDAPEDQVHVRSGDGVRQGTST